MLIEDVVVVGFFQEEDSFIQSTQKISSSHCILDEYASITDQSVLDLRHCQSNFDTNQESKYDRHELKKYVFKET